MNQKSTAKNDFNEGRGIDLRDWLAGQALGECIAWTRAVEKEKIIKEGGDEFSEGLLPDREGFSAGLAKGAAEAAYLMADAMLEAREKKGGMDHLIVYAADCEPCDCCDDVICWNCGEHYADCPCPGPMQEQEREREKPVARKVGKTINKSDKK